MSAILLITYIIIVRSRIKKNYDDGYIFKKKEG